MSKKPAPGKRQPAGTPARTGKPFAGRNFLPHWLILGFALILYGNTLTYDYTLDDLIVIKENAFTKQGFAGIGKIFSYDSFTGFFGIEKKLVAGGRYRPFSIATFAIEYGLLGGPNPFVSHLINILLYAFTGSLILLILNRFFKLPPRRPWYLGVPFMAAILFLAHPLHTEAVANIKGRDEILALLFSLSALLLTLRYFERKRISDLVAANIVFFFGVLSKENAILFAVMIPLSVHFFTAVPLRRNLTVSATLAATALLFVVIRFLVLGYFNSGELPRELLNNPFLFASVSEKFGTILYTLGLYIKLLFFPHPLTHDYYPYHIPLVPLTDLRAIVPLIIYLALIIYGITGLKTKSVVSYGILFYLITLFIVSNLVFPVGTFMNERFVYMPSLGFVIILAYLAADRLPAVMKNEKTWSRVIIPMMSVIVILLTIRTWTRNPAWKDNFTLFTTDVRVSANSIKCNVSAGGDYQKKAEQESDTALKAEYYRRSIAFLEKALQIYPRAGNGLLLYGNALAMHRKDYKGAIDQYLKVLEYEPMNGNARSNALKVIQSLDGHTESAYKIATLRRMLQAAPDNPEVCYLLGKQYGQFEGNLDSSRYFLERSAGTDPTNKAVFKDLGIVYSMLSDYPRALEAFSRAATLDPADPQIRQNIALTHQLMNSKNPVRR